MLAPDLDVRQRVAAAGLDPREFRSGTSVERRLRISKAGNQHLRRALYMPALVAVQHDPHLGAFYEKLQARRKTKLQALVAVMRKLLHVIFGLFKHRQEYQGQKAYALTRGSRPLLSRPAPPWSQIWLDHQERILRGERRFVLDCPENG